MRNRNVQARVAFADVPSGQWTAGRQYLKNIFHALGTLDVKERPNILLVSESADAPKELSPYVSQTLVNRSAHQARRGLIQRLKGRARGAFNLVTEGDLSIVLREAAVDCYFATGAVTSPLQVPTIGWIPDFQHIHHPEFFTASELEDRNRIYKLTANLSDIVVLSSSAVFEDFRAFVPNQAHKGRVLSFAASIPKKVFELDPNEVCVSYHLPVNFFYLPNQFWMHKNHYVVVEALKIAMTKEPNIVVVCTGNTNEYRNPLHFANLLAEISRQGLRRNLVILGMVDHVDIFLLMRQSVAVLQPSLFEGWSTTVEEVKALGKEIIISDIPVHREQNPDKAFFFNPRDAHDLAEKLVYTYRNGKSGPNKEMEASASLMKPLRDQHFAQTLLSHLKDCHALFRQKEKPKRSLR